MGFEDERAAQLLHQLLAQAPSAEISSEAHLYLGLIAFDSLRMEAARTEFQQALELAMLVAEHSQSRRNERRSGAPAP